MQSRTRHESYAQWLEREMQERGFTIRGLGRAWNPDNPDTGKRQLLRYLNKGIVPQERTRVELARVMGSPESGPSDDGSEADLDMLAELQERLAAATETLNILLAERGERVA